MQEIAWTLLSKVVVCPITAIRCARTLDQTPWHSGVSGSRSRFAIATASTWRFVDLLISDHVESVTEVMRRKLPFLIRASPSTVGIALFAELLLLVCFSIDDRFVVADIEDKISPPGRKDWEARETRRIRW